MTRFLIVAACLLSPSLALSAPADSTSTANAPRNSLRGGMWALQFDINGQLLSVSSFSGGLSLKRQFSPKSALRFGVRVNADGQNRGQDTAFPNEDGNSRRYGLSLETVYQRYFNPSGVVHAYWCVGPTAGYSHSKSESSSDSSSAMSIATNWNVGGIAALGAEWFFAPQFSLHAEYTAGGIYRKNTQENSGTYLGTVINGRKRENDGWSVSTSDGVRLGLSVYF